MDFSANLSLPYLLPNQAQKHVTVNETRRVLDAILQLSVASRTLESPPPNPADGARYVPATGATGEWSGRAMQIACFQDGAWRFFLARVGWMAWIEDEDIQLLFDGDTWIEPPAHSSRDKFGINATADGTNRLTVKSHAVLFDHDGSDHQLKINKAAITDKATLLFQSGYNGHAEMGLMGDADFNLKLSSDGQTFTSALTAKIKRRLYWNWHGFASD